METPTVRPTVRGDIEVAYLGHTVDAMIAEFMQQHDIPGLTLAIVQAPYIPLRLCRSGAKTAGLHAHDLACWPHFTGVCRRGRHAALRGGATPS